MPEPQVIRGVSSHPPPNLRRYGLHVVAGSGAGKSRYLGRNVVFHDFFIPDKGLEPATFVFDTGSTIDNFLHEMVNLERDWLKDAAAGKMWGTVQQSKAQIDRDYWSRIHYINMAGLDGLVTPLSLLTPLPGESPSAPAKRFTDTIARLYPSLEAAQVQGMPPLEQAATAAGTILTLLGGSIVDMAELVRNPKSFEGKILDKMREFPQLARLMAELTEVKATGSLLTKLSLFTFDEAMAATFGALHPGLDLQQVIDNREVVLFHFPVHMERSARRFAMFWTFWYVIRFLELRGPSEKPVSLVVDELSNLGNFEDSRGQAAFSRDLDYLINTFMRGHNVWVTLAHQQMAQFSETIQAYLFGMRTQIVGRANDRTSALSVAREMKRYDPYMVKKNRSQIRPHIIGRDISSIDGEEYYYTSQGRNFQLYQEPVEFSPIEQQYENANFFEDLPDLTFFKKTPDVRELFSIYWPDNKYAEQEPEVLAEVKRKLMQRDGREITDILAEIAASNAPNQNQPSLPAPKSPVKKRVPL